MPAIIAPQPHMSRPVVSSPPYSEQYASQPLKRLKSPITLPDSCIRASPQPSCSTQRRRSKSGAHSLRRRRTRVDCRVDSSPHIFDKLPWISALDSAPQHLDPWDIADLSLISDSCSSDLLPPPGIGPVRRRKTSQRSNPLAMENDDPHNRGEELPWALPFRDNSVRFTPIPQTPFSSFNPSRVLFQHLMPVSCDSLPNNDSL